MMPTVAFHHFGCKVNFSEASALSRQFLAKGYRLAGFHDKADIYVISSCAVTSTAEKKCKAAIRQAHRLNPMARIAVIGCFPELNHKEIAGMEGVEIVLGHQGKFRLLEALEGKNPVEREGTPIKDPDFIPSYSVGDRTRSFLKIQDGCDYHCAYCAIPLARGSSRSDTISHLLREARVILTTGIREIVLTGVNIGDFGKQNGETFLELLSRFNREIDIPRIRISSIEPDLLSDGIIELIAASEKILPHFHIPLQSGSNEILRSMKRKYTRELYADRVQKVRAHMPEACVATDVIAGFPGEKENHFLETVTFLESLPVSYMHVFTYSRRENTPASNASGTVPGAEKKRRSDMLHHLSDEKKMAFYLANRGKPASVLFESDRKEGMMHGFTGNYIRVKTPFDPSLINEIRTVMLEELCPDHSYLWLPSSPRH